ncbi:glucosaminidase domain-containing protein [Parashewanella tropica]|uniref:glucosaminidase domain-containing protein n=1 Tax=Parashewanella tropica TaxID=2547970 RepID=UPI00105A0B72|nr:glucosaminidase domain-containing protein [Parashewanella tropica]
MRTGKVGKYILALGTSVVLLYGFRVVFISTENTHETQDSLAIKKNKVETQPFPDFSAIKETAKRKEAFFNFIRPAVRKQNQLIRSDRKFIVGIKKQLDNSENLSDGEQAKLNRIANKYNFSFQRVNDQAFSDLLSRVDTVPEALVLVQAANESGWGTSRFARKGNNFFGQWCFVKGCGLIPSSRQEGLTHEVAVFKTVDDSIASYMNNLNTNAAYDLFRRIRSDLRSEGNQPTAAKLVYGLINYSERQDDYIDELLSMLRHNKQYLDVNNVKKAIN